MGGDTKRKLWIVITVIVVVIIIGAALAAITWPKPTTSTQKPVSQASQTLSITWANVPNIDPAIGSDEASSAALVNLYDTLVFPTESGALLPDLATNWTVSSNGLVYTFHLRHGVTFHNGDPLTAQDVVFSMNRLLTMRQGYSFLFSPYVANTTAPDNYTVVFTLKSPFALFMDTLVRLYILDQKQVMAHLGTGSYGSYGDYGSTWLLTHDAGSGPYQVLYVNLEANMTLVEYPHYWAGVNPGQPKYVQFIGTTNPSTVQALFSSKQIQITDMWQQYSTIQNLAALPGAKMVTIPSAQEMYLMINTQRPPTDDIYVREAMTYALNYTAIVTQAFPGSQIAAGPVPPILPGHDPSIPTSHQNLTLAQEVIKKSKYYGSLSNYPVTYYWVTEVPAEQKMAIQFASDMAKIGITVKVVGVPWLTVIADLSNESTSPNIVSIACAPNYYDASSLLQERYSMASQGTWEQNEWLKNSTISDMIAYSMTIQNQTERYQMYYKIQEMIYNLYISIYPFVITEVRAYYPSIVDWYAANGHPIALLGYDFVFRNFIFNGTSSVSSSAVVQNQTNNIQYVSNFMLGSMDLRAYVPAIHDIFSINDQHFSSNQNNFIIVNTGYSK
ncbi:MAG: ABC transporter substrate-binding protein [Thermoplasmata archaeon]